jgi:MFS family permease
LGRLNRLAALVGACVLVDTMFYAALTPLLPRYAHELGLSKAGAGVLAGSYAVGALVAAVPGALAASWLGVKRALLLGLGGMVVTTVLFGFAHTAWLLDVARFLQGSSSSFSWTAALAWLVADSPADSRGRLIGSAMGAAIFGALLGPVIGAIGSVAGTRGTFSGVACIGLGLAVWAIRTPTRYEPRRQPPSLLARSLANARVSASVWFVALPSLGFGLLNVLVPLRLSALGLGSVAIGAIWLTGAGLEASSSPVVGHLSDRRGRLLPLRAGLVGAAIVFALLPLLDGRWWLLAPGTIACGLTLGVFWAPAMSMLSDEADAIGLDYAFGFALINLAWAPAQIVGAAGGGALADATSDAVPFATLAALSALTLAVLWRFRSFS